MTNQVPNRSHIATEQSNPASAALDQLSTLAAVQLMALQDAQALAAVSAAGPEIARAIDLVAAAFRAGGRLLYIGAGTSGRLGVLDASECPPTFYTHPAMVVGIIAGGPAALQSSIENVEDDAAAGAAEIQRHNVTAHDVVFGIAAGGTTPFVHGALLEARNRHAKTVFLICTQPQHVSVQVDVLIALAVGPEVLTGSTRLKAGTATKLVLNTVTTLAMVQLGKTYGNLMVDVDAPKNTKLIDRGIRIIATLTGLDRPAATALFHAAAGKVKRAVVMHKKSVTAAQADQLLQQAQGRLRAVIG